MEPHRGCSEALMDLGQLLLALLGAKSLFIQKQASFLWLGLISSTIYMTFPWITRNPRPNYADPMINLVVPILICVACGLIVDSILDSPAFKWAAISIYILVTIVTIPDHKYIWGGFMKGLEIVFRTGCCMFEKLYDGFGGLVNLLGNGPLCQQADSGGSSHSGHIHRV